MSDHGLAPKYIMNSCKSTIKNNLNKKWAKDVDDHFTKVNI